MRNLEVLQFNRGVTATRVSSTDMNYQAALADATAETILIPDGARYVRLTGSKDFYAAFGSTAVTATINSTDNDTGGNAVEFMPYSNGEHWRFLDRASASSTAARGLSLISSSAQVVTAQFWKE